jgi:hypothetical protein
MEEMTGSLFSFLSAEFSNAAAEGAASENNEIITSSEIDILAVQL